MILSRIRLNPFGFFADKEVRFTPGLNVVLGANEAGKSTLFNAVRSALIRTRLKKPEFEKHISRFLPIGGGDTLRVELEFEAGAGKHTLKRRWGPRPASELVLPSGGSITDDDAIKAALESALPAKQGTFMRILMTGQAELMGTADAIGEAVTDLADILRKALAETGGVSADRFKIRLEEEIAASFSHWDAERNLPEKNRGIANPWKQEVGSILGAYYRMETVKAALERAREVEDGLDEANGRLRSIIARAAERERFLSENKKAAADAGEKRALEARLETLKLEQEKLKKANREWPVAESRSSELEKTIAGFAGRREPLEKERREAAKEEANRALRERMAGIAVKRKLLLEAEEKLAAAPKPDAKSLEALRELSNRVALLKSAESRGLSVRIGARRPLELRVQPDSERERDLRIKAGEAAEIKASSRVRITSADMEMDAASGEAGGGRELADAESAMRRTLSSMGASGLAEAEERQRAAELLSAEVRLARRTLEEELPGESLISLEKAFAKLGPASETRSQASIEADLARLDVELQAASREKKELQDKTSEWISAHGSQEKLLDALTDVRGKETALREKLASCAPLPEGFSDAESFLREYDRARDDLRECAEEKNAALVRKAELESIAPEAASGELSLELEEAESRFQAARRRGNALRSVRGLAEKLLAGSDAAIFSGMRRELETLVARMTESRYKKVQMDGSVPLGLEREDGGTLGWDRLSAGTKDTLALALRLAMASHFIGGKGGFLMMDDPLVDMDPNRQAAAAAALKEFAGSRQLILFTCHPGSAELLGGNRIPL
jgi:exonuclease SbcC